MLGLFFMVRAALREQWDLIEPVITEWKDRHRSVSGHQGAYEMREIQEAITGRAPIGFVHVKQQQYGRLCS
ncbi:hypothetical protein [Streptomyces nogalater]|uniref:Transposase n=1 Tax=Streptomyces nogalater TaxID=38314 RepID=A0ABW0WIR6_STRNO